MEKEFGLSKDRLEARFYNLSPATGEASCAFVLRVETARRGIGEGDKPTLHCFLP